MQGSSQFDVYTTYPATISLLPTTIKPKQWFDFPWKFCIDSVLLIWSQYWTVKVELNRSLSNRKSSDHRMYKNEIEVRIRRHKIVIIVSRNLFRKGKRTREWHCETGQWSRSRSEADTCLMFCFVLEKWIWECVWA